MPTPSKDFEVAIVGGGMCGLACAVALVNVGIKVTIFEAAPKFDEVGAGVGLGSNALRALNGLGLLEAVLQKADQHSPRLRLFEFISGTGEHETIFDYLESCGEHGNKGVGMYRPDFLDALVPLLDPNTIQFNKRCTSVHQRNSNQLLGFADGTTHEADLVIGADGIKSAVRNSAFGQYDTRLGFSGSYAYRGLVPIEALKAAGVTAQIEMRPICWVGLHRHLITFPIKNNTMLNIVAFSNNDTGISLLPERSHPWVEVVPARELLECYQGWGPDVVTILKSIKNPSRWSIHTLYPPLPTFVSGRIALVGDAAHGMTPHLGAGVGQGFEDVYTLCRLLGHSVTQKSNLDSVLAVYNELRPPRANMVLQRSLEAGQIYESYAPDKYHKEKMRQHLSGIWEPVWNHDLETQVAVAMKDMDNIL
ncbi:FAD/NAD(P)-binding domain-containing protein [Gymnopilus junonius]|uniref:FAD/NAD(P)-binding domain-containing protein n=1 Tax=Gymnopilus junonius TaxID=109634 RepID=A0A9P5P2K6_GYMJU|nr:FAD/NAD(P)-binding domain-containing protein [Gymnopilus junonius]